MADLTPSQNQKKLSGLCYENTVIDRKGRIRKIKPPIASKPRGPIQPRNLRADNSGERYEVQHPSDSFNTKLNLNTRNILEVNANETTEFQPNTKHTGEVLDNDANRLECSEPIWKERPGSKHASNPEPCRQEIVTTGQDTIPHKQGVVTTGLDITRDKRGVVTSGKDTISDKQGVVTSGQDITHDKQGVVTTGQDITHDKQGVVTTGQDITREKQGVITTWQDITHDKQGVVTTGQDIIRDVDNYKEALLKSAQLRFKVQKIQKHKIDRIEDGVAAANGKAPQKQELIRDVYELALENLDDDDDDDDDDEDDEEEEDEGGSAGSLRSESPDTLMERILENMDEDGISVDFDGDAIPAKPPRRKLQNQQKSFSDEILERLGETTQKSPDVAPTTGSYKANDRFRSSTNYNGTYDRSTARIPISQQKHEEELRRHSELSSAAAAAVIRLDRYIIDQQPIIDEEPKINYSEPEVDDAEPKVSHAEAKSSRAEPNSPPPASSLVTTAALSPDVVSQPTTINVPVSSNLSHAAVEPSVTTIQLADPRLVRERSPEEIFEEIVEAMRDTEGEYEDPFFFDWPAFFPAPGKSSLGGPRKDGVPVDYSVENDWLSFFYCNRVNVSDEATRATASQRRSSLGNSTQTVPKTVGHAADGVGIFVNTSLSASSSWMARPAKGTFPQTNLSKNPTSTRSEESPGPNQPEQVPMKSTEPVDVVIQSRGRPHSRSSRSEEQIDVAFQSNSLSSRSMFQNQPEPVDVVIQSRGRPHSRLSRSEEEIDVAFQSNSGPSRSMSQNPPVLFPNPASNLRASEGQSSKEILFDFVRADQTIRQSCPEVEPHTADVLKSVVQAAAYQNLDTDSQAELRVSGEEVQDLGTDAKSLPVVNPDGASSTGVELSPESNVEPKSFHSDNTEEVSVMDHPQIDSKTNGNPTALLFAALDAAFAQNTARTEAKSLKEIDIDSDGDTDNTLTPTEDISQGVILQSHCDASLNKQFFSLEPYDSVNDIARPENREHEFGKVNGPILQQSGGLHRSFEESKPQESQTEKTPSNVGAAAEEEDSLITHEIIDPSCMTELGTTPNQNYEDASRKREESSADIGVDISEISKVSEAEKIVTAEATSNDEKVVETDFRQTVANRDSIDPVTVHQPRPPKRVVKILSDEVTTQTVLLKIAWPAAKGRDRSRERIEQPFRELQLRRTIRMTDPGSSVPQTGRQITPSVPLPSTKNHSHTTSASGELLKYKTVESPSNNVVNSNGIASNNNVITSNDVVNNNETQSIAGAESQSPTPSSLATRPDVLVEYENQEQSHNTEVTQDSTVDVTQTDSVKVLLVPVETVYKVQDLKEIVAAVGKTILNDSRRIPVESNVRVTCEAVQSKSCASLQDRDVTIIRNTILDTYNSTNVLPVKASAE